jgi:hypothetical protein
MALLRRNDPKQWPGERTPGVQLEGTDDRGSVIEAFEIPRFVKASGQPRDRRGELLHVQRQPAIRLPFDDFLNVARSVGVGDPEPRTDDFVRLGLQLRNLDPRQNAKALEVGPIGDIQDFLNHLLGRNAQRRLARKRDRLHGSLLLDDRSLDISFAPDDGLRRIFWKSPIGLRQATEQEPRAGPRNDLAHVFTGWAEVFGHRLRITYPVAFP